MTDLVDSTGTTQRLGEVAASELWQAHDRIARALLHAWRGREVDKSDGFLLLFESASDAAAYALDYHRGIAALAEPLRARAGLHVGEISLRPNAAGDIERGAKAFEVDGWLAKPLASRTMSLAQGGQTLATAEGVAALAGSGLCIESHGHYRLQGIADPVELFEVGDARTTLSPPPDSTKAWRVVQRGGLWVPRRDVRHTLPAERDAFVGRQPVIAGLAQRFADGARLVSLLGTGGAGKTRLALRFGWHWLGDCPGGVWFCDLSAARSLDGIVYAVAQGLELPLGRADPIAQIGAALVGRGACLVILDNFEQVAQYAQGSVGAWLQQTVQARFLVTTREVLGIVGEQTLTVAPLPPDEAAALFLCRARDAGRELAAGVSEHAAVAPLVRLLDGLPLAIELAAARTRVMKPSALLVRMSERFRLLTSTRGRPQRQSTLRATLDWSWELLSPSDKSALAQLSVFEGSFDLADAEAVLDLSAFGEDHWVLDALQSLVEKSMLRAGGDEQFDLLRSVHSYAADRLLNTASFDGSGPDFRANVQRRHWQHYATFDEQAAAANGCAAADNLVAACRRATAAGDAASAAGALAAAWTVLRLTGPFHVALGLGERVLALADLGSREAGAAERVVGAAHELLGNGDEARARFTAALARAHADGDPSGEARGLCALGEHLYRRGESDEARLHLDQALRIATRLGLTAEQCLVLNALGTLETRLGRAAAARANYEAAMRVARELQDLRMQGGLLGNLAILAHDAGAHHVAQQQYEQALALAAQVHDRRWEGNTRCNLGLLHHEQGLSTEALREFGMALATAREIGHLMLEATVLCNLGIVFDAEADFEQALAHHAQAVSTAQRVGDRRAEGQFRGHLGLSLARAGRELECFEQFECAQALLNAVSDASSSGLLLCQRAHAERIVGHLERARATLGSVAEHFDVTPNSELATALARVAKLIGEGQPTR